MDKSAHTSAEDTKRIVPPMDPETRKLYDEIARRDSDLNNCKNPADFRKLLNYVNDATDEFLRRTSRDPFYHRPDNSIHYKPGDWI
jgi:hypothetical protein